jgi:prophage regulatory protein
MTASSNKNARKSEFSKPTPLPAAALLPAEGFVRITGIIGSDRTNPPTPAVIPVSRNTFLEGCKTGRFPKPVRGLGSRIVAWRVEDIRALIDRLGAESQEDHHES